VQPTVSEILALPEMARGRPIVVAGADRLDQPVRWVHISEHHDIARLMYGRELVLTTGVAWPDTPEARRGYIEDLADSGVAAVAIELVRLFHAVPPEMVEAARERGLPLIGLEREIRFIDVTRAVHALIMDSQVTELAALGRAHEVFTRLSVKGATHTEVLDAVSELTGRPVVLENMAHQVSAYSAADMSPTHLLADWETRSRRAAGAEEGPGSAWPVADVGARGEQWGRVVLVADDPMPPWTAAILERAASTIALNRLVERDRATLERHAHSELLCKIMDRSYGSEQWLRLRAESLGASIRGQRFVGMTVELQHPDPPLEGIEELVRGREDAECVAAAMTESTVEGLAGVIRAPEVAAILAVAPGDGDRPIERVARAVHRAFFNGDRAVCTIGVGSPVANLGDARRSLLEARHAAESVPEGDDDRLFYRISDVGISGLAHLLRNDPRLQTFVERTLSSLLVYDERHGSDLESILWAYLECGANKTVAADTYGLSRPAFYARLARIESILGVCLSEPRVRTSLHFALLSLHRMRASVRATNTAG
jgi:purine catabolism regulator